MYFREGASPLATIGGGECGDMAHSKGNRFFHELLLASLYAGFFAFWYPYLRRGGMKRLSSQPWSLLERVMSLHRVFLLLLALLACAAPVQAEIFKYYDSNGNLVLTDAPPKDKAAKAEKIESKPIMTIPALKGMRAKAGSESGKANTKVISYTIIIHSPENEASFQRAGDAIPVSVSVTPSLAAEHRLVLLLDGADMTTTGMIQPDGLDRGSHQLQARVQDGDGNVLASASSAFYIQSHSVLNPSAPKPKPKP